MGYQTCQFCAEWLVLKQRIADMPISRMALAKAVGINKSDVSRYFTKDQEPSYSIGKRIENYLNSLPL